MKIKNKFLIIFSLLLIFLFTLCLTCFGTEITYPDPTSTGSAIYKYHGYITLLNDVRGETKLILVGSNEESLNSSNIKIQRNSGKAFYLTNNSNAVVYVWLYYLNSDNTWYNGSLKTVNSGESLQVYDAVPTMWLESSFDILAYDGSILFQAPVQEIVGVEIPALETAEQIPQAIVTTLKILIPVGLIVLSVGLVIYLIKRVKYSIM